MRHRPIVVLAQLAPPGHSVHVHPIDVLLRRQPVTHAHSQTALSRQAELLVPEDGLSRIECRHIAVCCDIVVCCQMGVVFGARGVDDVLLV